MNGTEKQREFLQEVRSGRPMLLDGAMGTSLYSRGCFINRAFDEASLTCPEKVLAVHEEHIAAGADIIETNTFTSNSFLLGKYGIGDKVVAVNEAGVRIARQAIEESRKTVYLAGSVGPTGEAMGYLSDEAAKAIEAAFREQIEVLVEGKVDLLLLETFRHLQEMRLALKVARSLFPGAIIAQMSFTDGCLQDGTPPERVAEMLTKWGANMVGVNCDGPAHVYEVAVKMVKACRTPVVASPNAGQPRHLDQRLMYMATPEYFGVYGRRMLKAGVRVIGGCCGTTAAHLEVLSSAVRMLAAGIELDDMPESPKGQPRDTCHTAVSALLENMDKCKNSLEPCSTERKSRLAQKVRRVWEERLDCGRRRCKPKGPEDFVVSVEVNPAPGLDVSKRVCAAHKLVSTGIDVVNIADGPRANVRVSNTALGLTIMREANCEVILHVCCRDRNLLGLQSDILGYHVMGLHNLVVITGDPPKMGDYPKATAVFDLDSVALLRLIDGLNRGVDPSGKVSKGQQTNFFLATGAEPGAVDFEREISRLKRKINAGAELIMTQPVYSVEVAEKFLDAVEPLGVPVLLGICPLVSSRNAEFLHNEVPGMSVPEDIRERMRKVGRGPEAIAEGIKIAREMVDALQDRVVGIYQMIQLGKFSTALDVLEGLGYGEYGEVPAPPGSTPLQNGNKPSQNGTS